MTAGGEPPERRDPPTRLDRRRFVRLAALSGAAALAGCAGPPARGARGGQQAIRLGYVSPSSGPLFPFAQADAFVIEGVEQALAGGLTSGGRSYRVEILHRDSQSSPERAAEVARDLIERDQVALMLAASTPETTNPVADVCEEAGLPCISTATPYQSWFRHRNPAPDPTRPEPYRWTWHFFWGLEDVVEVYSSMWGQVEHNDVVGGLWPDDVDGQAWGQRFPKVLGLQGYEIVDGGRYPSEKNSFAAEIDRFKAAGAEIVTGVPLPSDFSTFWQQAAERDYRPKVVSMGRALYPGFIESIGAAGVSTEVWWSPAHPYRSSLTGASAAQLAEDYQRRTGRQWIQPIGLVHALFEVAVSVLRTAGEAADRQAVADAIKATRMATVAGPVDWTSAQADVPNVSRTPLVGGQWRTGTTWPLELQIVSNAVHPEIPAAGRLQPIR
jgi:branched-chain amino acid transport system substrate-binding protein